MTQKGLVFNIQKFSLQDGPGIRTSIFVKGCPLRCEWCANPESQNPFVNIFIEDGPRIDVKRGELSYDEDGYIIEDEKFDRLIKSHGLDPRAIDYEQLARPISTDRLVEIALEDEVFYGDDGGVTISGGEPLMQADFLVELVKKLKAAGIHTAIESSLFADIEDIRRLYPHLDLFIMDAKNWNDEIHREKTGVGNSKILSNMEDVVKNAKDYLVRIPVIPNFNYSDEDAYEFLRLFKKIGVKKVELLPFHQLGEEKYKSYGIEYGYKDIKALDEDALGSMVKILKDGGIEAFV